jgi:hypothetical protein
LGLARGPGGGGAHRERIGIDAAKVVQLGEAGGEVALTPSLLGQAQHLEVAQLGEGAQRPIGARDVLAVGEVEAA